MILRIRHGWTTRDNADSYQQLLDTTIAPATIAPDVHKRPADFLRCRSASLPVSPRPARPSVECREIPAAI
jgi:hypothetical protein